MRYLLMMERVTPMVTVYASKVWEEQQDGTWKIVKDRHDGEDCIEPELHNQRCKRDADCAVEKGK
jgi:hypothetical protein